MKGTFREMWTHINDPSSNILVYTNNKPMASKAIAEKLRSFAPVIHSFMS